MPKTVTKNKRPSFSKSRLPVARQAMREDIQSLKTRVDNLSSLIEVSIIISSTLDLDELINLVMKKAQSVMNAEASSVMLINEQTGMLEWEVALGEKSEEVKNSRIQLHLGEGIAGWVAQRGEPLIVPDVSKDSRFFRKSDDATGFKTRSILAVPLKVQDRMIGVAEVINPLNGKAFTEDDLDLFSTFSRQVALAIENARMHRQMIEKEKLEQQLASARIIQESFMPQAFPRDARHRFEVAARSIPATHIGGDFYDFFEFGQDSLGLVIGDVSGKGVPAALYMARLVSDFRFYTQLNHDPATTLTKINEILVERGRRGMFVTLQYGAIDLLRGRVTMASGGHLPPLWVREHGARSEAMELRAGVPLGIMNGVSFEQLEFNLQSGDSLVFFTDGVIEAKNKNGEQYSMRRLDELVRRPWTSPKKLIDAVIEEVAEFSQGAPQHDDITVMALQWK
jgi:sigma-B regulation protein RsbU (phosphoserine phosphatase)